MPVNGKDVKFNYYTRAKFDALSSKDSNTIYYVEETNNTISTFIGDREIGTGIIEGLTENGKIKNSVLPDTFQNLTDGSSNLPYRFDLIVYGDSDKYYPVHFAGGNQDLLRTIKIWRRYQEQAPNDWNTSTHKGSLNLEWKGNYGNWGGAVYTQWIYENSSQYTTLLAGTQLVDNSYGMAFFLRGGGTTGAIYHFASDQPLTWTDSYLTYTEPTAFYNQEKTFAHTNSSHERYAPAPRTTVDTSQINSITVVKGNDSRLTNARPASDVSAWAKTAAPSNIRYLKMNANNTITWRTAADFRGDIGAGTSNFSGSYNDLSNKPSIPTIPSVMGASEGITGTATTQRTINAANLKSTILSHSPAGARPSSWSQVSERPTSLVRQVSFSGGTMTIEVI